MPDFFPVKGAAFPLLPSSQYIWGRREGLVWGNTTAVPYFMTPRKENERYGEYVEVAIKKWDVL